MAKLPPPLDRKVLAELEAQGDDGKKLAAKMRADRTEELDALYPKPDAGSIQRFYEREHSNDAQWNEVIRQAREMRYMRDELPEKMQKDSKHGRRFRTRLSDNEVLRTAAIQCRNDYKVKVPAAGGSEKATKQGQKQTRWCQQLRAAFERKAGKPLRRIVVDNQHGDAIGAWEFFLTDAYDRLDLEKQREGETPHAYNARTEEALKRAGMPFGIRPVDKLGLFYREDEDGVSRAVIVERKLREEWDAEERYRQLQKKRNAKVDEDGVPIPDPHVAGAPIDSERTETGGDTVECIKYYDRRWYAYMVEGRLVDCDEHHLPDCPIVLVPGIPTGSPNRSEALQGVTWGMYEMERFLNDLFTREWDNAFRFQNPKVVITTPADGKRMFDDEAETKPTVLRLDDGGMPQLNPGQVPVNITQNWDPYDTSNVVNVALQMWQRSGLNAIASGEAPGSDPAGYTVNSLQGAAQNLYEVLLDNEARAWEKICDLARLVVRDTLNETVYLASPMADSKEGGTEWLGLSPDDVDETPTVVYIDPLSDANRLAIRQSLMEGNLKGFIKRDRVQTEGFGVDDTRAEDKQMALDELKRQMVGLAVQDAIQRVQMMAAPPAAPPAPVILGPNGQPLPPSNAQQNGGAPADPNPPTVGAANAAASQGVPGAASRGRAGQDSGYRPPAGVMQPT